MAKTDKLTNEQKEIIRAQNDALLRLPADINERLKLYADARILRARENDQIAQVKKESGLRDHEKRLVEDYKIVPQVLKIMATLAKMPATARAAACRQLIKAIDDEQFIYRDMFDEGAIGQTGSDLEGRAVFDETSEGRRRGGATAQPRSTEDMAKSNVVHLPQHKPTEGIPLDEARQKLEAYRAANPPKPGAKKKELRDLEKAVEDAETAHNARESAADPLADKPEAKPGEVTEGLRQGAGESEQHIRDAVAEKPKRASRKKASTEPTGPVEQQASADEDDDTIDVDGPAAPPAPPAQRPDALGTAPSSYRAG
jgi:hypothetical protein